MSSWDVDRASGSQLPCSRMPHQTLPLLPPDHPGQNLLVPNRKPFDSATPTSVTGFRQGGMVEADAAGSSSDRHERQDLWDDEHVEPALEAASSSHAEARGARILALLCACSLSIGSH